MEGRIVTGQESRKKKLVTSFSLELGNVPELDSVYGCTTKNMLKTTELYTFKKVNFMVCKLYLNKDVI